MGYHLPRPGGLRRECAVRGAANQRAEGAAWTTRENEQMISAKKLHNLMRLAIEEAAKSKPEDASIHPLVGAVIVDDAGKVLAKASRGERGRGDHAEFIAISKAREAGHTDFSSATIFATLEPCTHRGPSKKPCAERIVKEGFRAVYIGALDPNPAIVGHGETYLRMRNGVTVERFPAELERQIRELNRDFWGLFSSAHLPSNSLYITTRVSDIVLRKLKAAGIDLDYLPSDTEYSLRDLAAYVHGKGRFAQGASQDPLESRRQLLDFLRQARAEAFDEKYCDYTYDQDARKIEERWKKEFPGILKRFHVYDFAKRRVLNVGFGNGLEGVGLFEGCDHFTGVDIAHESLLKAQALFPKSQFVSNPAESLMDVRDDSIDIYVSLRTYQSAFFDVRESVREAYRVLAPGGVILISVANAYLDGNSFIKGLLPHGSTIVDQERAHDLVNTIRRHLTKMRLSDIGVHSGKAEEYVFARKGY